MFADLVLLGGSAHPALARAVADGLGVEPGAAAVEHFPDGEVSVRLLETVRGRQVFVLLPTSPPVNDHLMELLAFADSCRRAAAERVTALVPYYGYARSDKRHGRREPIAASLVAALMQTAGIDHLVTMDLHTEQIEGFFRIPVDTLSAVSTLCGAIAGALPDDTVVVAPDAGRVRLATRYAQQLDRPLAVLHKRRESGSETEVTHLVGDVDGRSCLVIDDMISTGGTLVGSAEALLDAGARELRVAASHGLLLDGAAGRLTEAGYRRIWVTDTIAAPGAGHAAVEIVSISPLLVSVVRRLCKDHSLQDLR